MTPLAAQTVCYAVTDLSRPGQACGCSSATLPRVLPSECECGNVFRLLKPKQNKSIFKQNR